jgi:hypothetical protein
MKIFIGLLSSQVENNVTVPTAGRRGAYPKFIECSLFEDDVALGCLENNSPVPSSPFNTEGEGVMTGFHR